MNRLVCAMILNDPYSGFDAEATRKQVIHDVITELNEAVSQYGAALAQPITSITSMSDLATTGFPTT